MQPYTIGLLVTNKGRDTTFFTNLKERIRLKYHYDKDFDMIAYENRTTIATCDKLSDVETIMKNIALAYEKGVKAYFVK